MKRDMQLIPWILRHVRCKADGKAALPIPDFLEHELEFVRYHVGLCKEAGFLRAKKIAVGEFDYEIWNLTWDGHEFLEQNRD